MNHYILLAKEAVETYIREGKIVLPPDDLPKEFFETKSGVFITIEKEGKLRGLPREERKRVLRGCIGTYLPTEENIAKEIISNAISAATKDYRFQSIQKQDLPFLSYTVYLLSEPQSVKDLEELSPKVYGIIVRTLPAEKEDKKDVVFNGRLPYKTGLLLPDLEGIDSVEKQISTACQKAGIDPEKEKIVIYRFSVKKYQ